MKADRDDAPEYLRRKRGQSFGNQKTAALPLSYAVIEKITKPLNS